VEAKCAKLEDDYRTLSAACSQARTQVAALTADKGRLEKELADHQAVVHERDELKKELATRTKELETVKKDAECRTTERDALQARCDRLKKGIQTLLGQDDAGLAPVAPVSSAPAGPALAPS
jgi:predicted RNase H-like nuclease (RuvC/YqgF family)